VWYWGESAPQKRPWVLPAKQTAHNGFCFSPPEPRAKTFYAPFSLIFEMHDRMFNQHNCKKVANGEINGHRRKLVCYKKNESCWGSDFHMKKVASKNNTRTHCFLSPRFWHPGNSVTTNAHGREGREMGRLKEDKYSKMQQTPQRYLENIISLIYNFSIPYFLMMYISDGYFRKQSTRVQV
jgi:hypothetical protein